MTEATQTAKPEAYVELLEYGIENHTDRSVVDVRADTLHPINGMEARLLAAQTETVSGSPEVNHLDRLGEEGYFLGPVGDNTVYQYESGFVTVVESDGEFVDSDNSRYADVQVYINLLERVITDSTEISLKRLRYMSLTGLERSQIRDVVDTIGYDPMDYGNSELAAMGVFASFDSPIEVFQYDEEKTASVECVWRE